MPSEQLPGGVTLYKCPLCDWVHAEPAPGVAENPGTLAHVFGYGVFATQARWARVERIEGILRDHFSEHKLEEWVKAAADAKARETAIRAIHKKSAQPAMSQPVSSGVARGQYYCTGCTGSTGIVLVNAMWPCPTIKALDETA